MVDGKNGLDARDYYIRDLLIKFKKDVIVLVNKIDNEKRAENIYEFYELGFPNVVAVSGEHNIGFMELLETITKDIKEDTKELAHIPKICIIGRPNVGKSSLLNASIDTKFTYDKKEYVVVDTAGLRKRGRIYENVEKFSYFRSMRAIDEADVCVLIVSASEGIIEHDKHILGYAIEAGKGVVVAVNKWDTVSNPNTDIKAWKTKLSNEFQFADFLKIVFVSAKYKKRIHTLMPEIISALENNQKEIPTNILNNVVTEAVSLNAPPSYKGKRLKIYFVTQTGVKPPKFTFHVNNKTLVHFSYKRYLENKIRESFDLTGTPIILQFKNKNERE